MEERLAFYDRSARYTPVIGTRVGRGLFVVQTEDKNVGRSLFAKRGRGDISTLGRAVTLLKGLYGDEIMDGKTFIDVGANIGTATIPALLEHGFDRAVSIEPEHGNYVTLRANAALNELDDRVIALRAAASNAVGTAELVVNRTQGGKHWIATDQERRSRAREEAEIVKVKTVTLDALVARGLIDPERTGMLWMDAQCHEGHIIEGASALTERAIPIVLEWEPEGLDKFGDRGKIEEIGAQRYTHFAGMRPYDNPDAPKFWMREIDALGDYAQRFLGPNRDLVLTDILMVRLTEDQVPDRRVGDYIDLTDLIGPRPTGIARVSRAPVIGPLLRRTVRRARASAAPARGHKRKREGGEREGGDRELRRQLKAVRSAERQARAVTKAKARKTKKKQK